MTDVHATTVRFPESLWMELQEEAKRHGVSVSQYVRDAAVTRLARESPELAARLSAIETRLAALEGGDT